MRSCNIVSKSILAWLAALFCAQAFAQDVITYYHTDISGSPIAATDASGELLWREDFSPYGERLQNQAAANGHHIWFTGHHHEERSGLTYAGARHYDPMIGRFMSVDPAQMEPANQFTFNRYAYANNNPYAYVDPNGDIPIFIPILIVAGKALTVASAGITAYETTTVVRDVAVGDMSVREALSNEAPGLALGVATGVTGKVVSKAGRQFLRRTYTREPSTLQDQMTLEAAMRGEGLRLQDDLRDPDFHRMEKWEYRTKSVEDRDSVVHYVRDPKTGELHDFKFKKRSSDTMGRYERTRDRHVGTRQDD